MTPPKKETLSLLWGCAWRDSGGPISFRALRAFRVNAVHSVLAPKLSGRYTWEAPRRRPSDEPLTAVHTREIPHDGPPPGNWDWQGRSACPIIADRPNGGDCGWAP